MVPNGTATLVFLKFVYFWLHWVFVAVYQLSLVVASSGYSCLKCASFSLQWFFLLRSTGSGCWGFSWHTGSMECGLPGPGIKPASLHGRQILNRWTTREVPGIAALEDSLAVSYKAEHSLTTQSSNHTPRYIPTWLENLIPHKVCEQMFISALL